MKNEWQWQNKKKRNSENVRKQLKKHDRSEYIKSENLEKMLRMWNKITYDQNIEWHIFCQDNVFTIAIIQWLNSFGLGKQLII
jgi:hypothetical protein